MSQKYHYFYNFTPSGYFILDKNGIILEVNSRGAELLGIEEQYIIKKEFISFIISKSHDLFLNTCKNTIRTRSKQECELELIREDKTTFWVHLEIIFSLYENQFKLAINDINERKEVEMALLANERKFRISLETLLDAFAIFSACRDDTGNIVDFKFEYINEVGCKLNQKTYGEQVGYNFLETLPEHQSSGLFEEYVQVVESGEPLLKESLIYEEVHGKKKLFRAFDIRAVKLGDGLAVAWRDVTERKNAEREIKKSLKEKELLLKEIHHRIKNNMQVISSLLGLQSQCSEDEKITDILKESQERVKSMAIVHEKLYSSKDFTKINFKEYIKELLSNLFNSYDADKIKLKVKVDNVFLGIDTAIPCGLILNELITNSMKYAFPTTYGREPENKKFSDPANYIHGPSNEKEYEICVYLSSNDNELIMIISDNGIGFSEDINLDNTGTLGFLIVKTLVKQIKGNINLIKGNGTTFEIKFPYPDSYELNRLKS